MWYVAQAITWCGKVFPGLPKPYVGTSSVNSAVGPGKIESQCYRLTILGCRIERILNRLTYEGLGRTLNRFVGEMLPLDGVSDRLVWPLLSEMPAVHFELPKRRLRPGVEYQPSMHSLRDEIIML